MLREHASEATARPPIGPLAVPAGNLRDELVRTAHWVADYLESVATRPVVTPRTPSQRQRLLTSPLRNEGRPIAEFLDFVEAEVAPYPCGNGHPAFFGWINTPPAPVGIIAELLSVALNPSCGMGEHAAMDMEHGAVRALAELAGLPPGTGGVLTSGGSMANLLCLAAARTWYLRQRGVGDQTDGADYANAHARLVCYQTAETHMSVGEAAQTIGLPAGRLRNVPLTSDSRMDPVALRAAIRADIETGLLPFCVVSTVGTTATGAVDPIQEITAVCREFGSWHHADGAYGGLGAAHPDLAPHYAGIDQVDSLTVDPHKTLNVPIGCGSALVTDPTRLRDAFSLTASYLDVNEELPWMSDYTFELTRPAGRALTVWAVLHQLGRQGVSDLIDHYLRRTRLLRELVAEHRDLQLIADGPWSVTCFRYLPADPGLRPPDPDTFTAELGRRLQDGGRAFLATVRIRDTLALRASVCNYQTSDDDIRTLVNEVLTIGEQLTKS